MCNKKLTFNLHPYSGRYYASNMMLPRYRSGRPHGSSGDVALV